MALQYITNHLLPSLDEINHGTFARVQKYITENSVEQFDPSNRPPSPSLTQSSNCDCCNQEESDNCDDEHSYTSSTEFDLSLSQLSILSRSSSNPSPTSLNSNEDDLEEPPSIPKTNLLNIPSKLKQYMDQYPDVSNLIQSSIDLISTECTDLEKYMDSDFGIFSLMKEVLSSPEQSNIHSDQNLEMIYEMTEILQEKIYEMESATENLTTTQETFQNILETFNDSSSM